MRIGYVVSTLRATGPTRQLLNILRHLNRCQCKPYVVTLSPEPVDSLWPAFEAAGVPVDSLGLDRLSGLFVARAAIAAWMRQRGIDVLHTQGVRADVIGSGLRAAPRIATLRNIPSLDYLHAYGLAGRALAWLHLRALRRFDRVAVVADASQKMLSDEGLNIEVVRNGVDVDWFRPALNMTEKERLRAELELSAALVMVTTGGLSQRKNQEVAIEAVQKLPDAELVIVGEGESQRRVNSLLRKGGCRLVGRQTDVRPWLKAADLFISTSHAEGMPNAVLEAMACGLPVALSDIPPHREILSGGNVTCGVLVNRDNPAAVAREIETFSEGLEGAGAIARRLIVENFHTENTARQYQDLYGDLLNQ